MIYRQTEISNEISWSQFGVEEDLQKLVATTLCIQAVSFYTFWLVLGELTFDRENELQMEKFKMFWKLDSTRFPTSYHTPNLDTRKAFKNHLQKCVAHQGGTAHQGGVAHQRVGTAHQRGIAHQAVFSSVNLHWHCTSERHYALGSVCYALASNASKPSNFTSNHSHYCISPPSK